MEMLHVVGYFAAILIGVTLGLVGGGGSILTMPILVYLFALNAEISTAYSLFIVGLSALVGSFSYAKQKLIDYKTGIIFSIPAFVGVYLTRRYLMHYIPEHITTIGEWVLTKNILIMGTFAVVMIAAAYSMIKGNGKSSNTDTTPAKRNYGLITLEGLIVGMVTGFVGAGGGFLIIPALVILAKLPMKTAVGTSLLIIAVKSLFGFLGDVGANASIDWQFLLTLSGLSIFGIGIGTYAAKFVPNEKLKPAFGWFVLVLGTYILLKELVF